MTIAELAQAIRDYHHIGADHDPTDLVIINRGILNALNDARKWAERSHDFAYAQVHAVLAVSPATGGSLDAAMVGSSQVRLKSLIAAYLPQGTNGLLPLHVRPRKEYVATLRKGNELLSWGPIERWPTESYGDSACEPLEVHTVGRMVFLHPDPAATTNIKVDAYRWLPSYTSVANTSQTDFLLEDGSDFLMWRAIYDLNHRTEVFVQRQEGTLPPPKEMFQNAWDSLVLWDSFMHEEGRDHHLGY